MRPSLKYGLHPLLPSRLGFRTVLRGTNPNLAGLLDRTDDFTLVPERSRVTIAREARGVVAAGVPGDFAEFGTHRGGTAAIIAAALPVGDRTLHLFDRWGDLPEPSAADGPQQQRYAKANIPDKLQDLIDRPPLAATQDIMTRTWRGPVRYYQGWFDETLPTYDGRPFAFAFVDCDYYNSVKPVLEFIIANAAPGCVIVVDDYVGDWVGARRAVDELGRPVETVLSQAIIRL
jgi:hypothetical protein